MDSVFEEDQALQAVIGGLDHDQMDFKKLEELLSMPSNDLDGDPYLFFGGFPDQNEVSVPQPEDSNSLNEANDLVAYLGGGGSTGVLSPPQSDEDPYSPSGNTLTQPAAGPAPQSLQYLPPQPMVQTQRPDPHLLSVLQHRFPTVPLEQLIQGLQSGSLMPHSRVNELQRRGTQPLALSQQSPSMTPPHSSPSPGSSSTLSPASSTQRSPHGLNMVKAASPPAMASLPAMPSQPYPVDQKSGLNLRMAKKRRYDEGSNGMPDPQPSAELNHLEFEPIQSGSIADMSYQSLKWQPHCPGEWTHLLDTQLQPIVVLDFHVEADKGFNFSTVDDAFVCQKKNHFQITASFGLEGPVRCIQTLVGPKPLESLRLHVHGMKLESQSSHIKVEQSQPDRSKKRYEPPLIRLENNGRSGKATVGRLHFSETTSNNMRKKGKPNPDQRYFSLVVSLFAYSRDGHQYKLAAQNSERIIVRASNPGQFENDDGSWKTGHNADTVYYTGRVGINTDRPEESLVVHGNLRVTGKIQAPSDERAKDVIGPVDTKQQLKNVAHLPIYQYRFKDEVAEYLGLPESERDQVGVLAQELRGVLPDAVKETDDINLPSGETIEKFLVVDKDRLYMENVGAVKELCKLTDALEDRIGHLEKIQKKLKRKNSHPGSLSLFKKEPQHIPEPKSDESSELSSLSTTPSSTISRKTGSKMKKELDKKQKDLLFKQSPLCTPCFMQGLIILLIIIMATSAIAMAILFAMSDDSSVKPTMSVTYGVNGTNGTNGMNGTNGTNGTAFSPADRKNQNSTHESNMTIATTKPPTQATVKHVSVQPSTEGSVPSIQPSRPIITSSASRSATSSQTSSVSSGATPDSATTPFPTCCAESSLLANLSQTSQPINRPESNGQEPVVPPIANVELTKPAGANFTLEPYCSSCRGNITYYVDIPGDFNLSYLTITLTSSKSMTLYLCSNGSSSVCPGSSEVNPPVTNLNQGIVLLADMEYSVTLPILYHLSWSYTFRAVESGFANCGSPLSDAGETYTFYSFRFVKVCGISAFRSQTS
eukprot:m.22345 g.22345  ORF g.22345 m.22345 type:complete len:1044 (+) comp28334_c0_seq1:2066-5197(+)